MKRLGMAHFVWTTTNIILRYRYRGCTTSKVPSSLGSSAQLRQQA